MLHLTKKYAIIIPTYNVGRYISRTLDSVQKQTLHPSHFETIIVDDGSMDDTVNIIRGRIKGMKNVALYSNNENKGSASTRNKAIKMSFGKYIMPLDGDDLLVPESVEATINFMEKNPLVKYSYSRHKRIDADGNFLCNRPGYPFSIDLLRHFNFVGALTCFSKDIHKIVGGYDSKVRYGMDWDHVLRISEAVDEKQIAQNPQYLYNYRIRPGSISTNNNEERKKYIAKFLYEHLVRENIGNRVSWDHLTDDKYNYFDWEKRPTVSCEDDRI